MKYTQPWTLKHCLTVQESRIYQIRYTADNALTQRLNICLLSIFHPFGFLSEQRYKCNEKNDMAIKQKKPRLSVAFLIFFEISISPCGSGILRDDAGNLHGLRDLCSNLLAFHRGTCDRIRGGDLRRSKAYCRTMLSFHQGSSCPS